MASMVYYRYIVQICEVFNHLFPGFTILSVTLKGDVIDVASDVGVNLCNVKSCLNTSNNEIFTGKRGDLPCVNISKHTCPVVK